MFVPRTVAIVLIAAIAGAAAPARREQTLESTGVADIKGGDVAKAREEAIAIALRHAVSRARGQWVESRFSARQSETSDGRTTTGASAVSDDLRAEAKGFVRTFDVVREERDGTLYRVTVRAIVDGKKGNDRPRLAALPAHVTPKLRRILSPDAIDEAILAAAQASGRYEALGERDMNALADFERQAEAERCAGDACGRQFADAVGADLLLVVTIADVQGDAALSVKLIEVENARVVSRRTTFAAHKAAAIIQATEELVKNTLGDSQAHSPSPAPPPRQTPCIDAPSCLRFGNKWLAAHQPALAAEAFAEACRLGLARGCGALGGLKLEGLAPGDRSHVRDLLHDACSGGDGRSCALFAEHLSPDVGYADFLFQQAFNYLEPECAADPEACAALADLHRRGKGTARNEEKAAQYLAQACRGGLRSACGDSAAPADPPKPPPGICADQVSCYLLARDAVKEGRAASYRRAADFFQRACEKGHTLSCVELGKLMVTGNGVALDFTKAARVFRSACTQKEARGCSNLAAMMELGRGMEIDELNAYELYAQSLSLLAESCELKRDHAACCQEAWHYEYGKGTKASTSRARSLYSRCCGAGVELGCERQKALSP